MIDTDAPTLEDAASDPDLSGAATIDTVRVDVLDASDGVSVFREFSAASRIDWPLSFAFIPPERGDAPAITLRIRAYRARDAQPVIEAMQPTLSPLPELALDRVVVVPPAAEEQVTQVRVTLSAECLGQPASFGSRTSCVDGAHRAVPFAEPLPVDPGGPSRVGTSPLARAVPCAGAPVAGRVCIPGGLSVLGSALIAGVEDGFVTLSPLPARLVRLSPFFMDVTEVTVGRARPLLGRLHGPQPYRAGGTVIEDQQTCTLSDASVADDLPLNCVDAASAGELCALLGGALPTEAEWNHAATGRGEARRYPWGDASVECCSASAGRHAAEVKIAPCAGSGIERVGSHRPSAKCNGVGDVSRDGVLDLGGSLTEILADHARLLDDACWGPRFGILLDPVCNVTSTISIATRGGEFSAGPFNTTAALRRSAANGSTRGFRCVYRDGAR